MVFGSIKVAFDTFKIVSVLSCLCSCAGWFQLFWFQTANAVFLQQ